MMTYVYIYITDFWPALMVVHMVYFIATDWQLSPMFEYRVKKLLVTWS